MHALKKWRHLLLGRHFRLCTDHRPILWLRSEKDLCGRLGRWALLLQEFDFTVDHISGQQHVVPDALSRSIPDSAQRLEVIWTTDRWSRRSAIYSTVGSAICEQFGRLAARAGNGPQTSAAICV